MPVERQLAGALVKDLAVDIACLLGSEKDAERSDRIWAAPPKPLLPECCSLRILWSRDRAGHAGVGRRADDIDGDALGRILHRDDARQRHDPELGRAVIALPDIAEQ